MTDVDRFASPAPDARDMLVAANPDPSSRLGYLLRLPLGGGMVFRTSGTWPRTKALYCYPVDVDEWPAEPEIVERAPIRSCVRRGAAIDLILERGRENRSQIVFTTARGREAVFWQSPRTRKQARPNVTTPTARAAGIASLQILVDTREQYAYRFATQQVSTVKYALPCGDYGITADDRLVAAVERKSLADLVSSLMNGTLRYAVGDLAALPRAAIVVEDRYSQVFKLDWVRPAMVADGLAELQVRWPDVPIVFCETRPLAEEWTYRYLAAAHAWAETERAVTDRMGIALAAKQAKVSLATPLPTPQPTDQPTAQPTTAPPTAQVRAWANAAGILVPERGRLHGDIWQAWRLAQGQ
ncbi:ERCC4 domain-containing protein [Lapillicoccus sp.]|uniref:ERCC4 domain-containing protein n=1 Tax=Lapillicoccus sp. TaxID=1909287 RepID=UPI0032630E72